VVFIIFKKENTTECFVAIYGLNSFNYILVVEFLWSLGIVVVLCPMKELDFAIEKWLISIGVRYSIYLSEKPKFKKIYSYYFDIIFKVKNKKKINIKKIINSKKNAVVFSTSGTKIIKAVLHTFRSLFINAIYVAKSFSFYKNKCWLISLPLHHISGFSIYLRSLIYSGKIIFKNKYISFKSVLRDKKITHLSLVPTQLFRILKNRNNIFYLRKLNYIVVSGDFCSQNLWNVIKKFKLPVVISYGSTETASQICLLKSMICSSYIYPIIQLKILYNNEIFLKGETIFKGYFTNGYLKKCKDMKCYFYTGDLGRVFNDNILVVLGRKDNMFISGGENIYPEEIENTLKTHKLIEKVIVLKKKSFEFGYRPVAVIKMNFFVSFNVDRFLYGKLSKIKIPVKYFYWPKKYNKRLKDSRVVIQRLFSQNKLKILKI